MGCQMIAPLSERLCVATGGTRFPPRRSLSSIITWGGLENDSGRQLKLTVWGPNINSTLLGKQGWWWPLFPKICGLKNKQTKKLYWVLLAGSVTFLIIRICNFFHSHKLLCGFRAHSHQECLEQIKHSRSLNLFGWNLNSSIQTWL